jgi:hypothetical protein
MIVLVLRFTKFSLTNILVGYVILSSDSTTEIVSTRVGWENMAPELKQRVRDRIVINRFPHEQADYPAPDRVKLQKPADSSIATQSECCAERRAPPTRLTARFLRIP